MNEDENLRSFSLDKVSATLSDEDRARLAQVYSKEFKTKQRVTTLMSRDKNDLERLQNESVEKVASLERVRNDLRP